MMTHRERVQAALKKADVDRVPFTIWYHTPHKDQDPIALCEYEIELAQKYDFDLIKMCPFGNYPAMDYGLSCNFFCTTTDPVKERLFRNMTEEDWKNLPVFGGDHATYGRTLEISIQMKRLLKEKGLDIPFIQTIFNPLTVAAKLCGPKLWEDIKAWPDAVKQGLEAITQTQINFINANIEAGVDGFFYASQTAREGACDRATHAEFAEPYDIRVAKAYEGKTWLNVLHVHGDNTYWDVMSKYPGEVVNWHDRWAAPTMAEARKLSDKCFLGGVNEKAVFGNPEVSPEEVQADIMKGIKEAGRNGLIIGPGCVASPSSPETHFYAAGVACAQS